MLVPHIFGIVTHFEIPTGIHPNNKQWYPNPKILPVSYSSQRSLPFTFLPIFYVLTFQIRSLLLWCFGGFSCPVLLLCKLLDMVNNTLPAHCLLWTTLLLGCHPGWTVTDIILWSRVSIWVFCVCWYMYSQEIDCSTVLSCTNEVGKRW